MPGGRSRPTPGSADGCTRVLEATRGCRQGFQTWHSAQSSGYDANPCNFWTYVSRRLPRSRPTPRRDPQRFFCGKILDLPLLLRVRTRKLVTAHRCINEIPKLRHTNRRGLIRGLARSVPRRVRVVITPMSGDPGTRHLRPSAGHRSRPDRPGKRRSRTHFRPMRSGMGTFPICYIVCHFVPRSAPPGGGPTIPLTPWGSPRILGIPGAHPETPWPRVPAERMRVRTGDPAITPDRYGGLERGVSENWQNKRLLIPHSSSPTPDGWLRQGRCAIDLVSRTRL